MFLFRSVLAPQIRLKTARHIISKTSIPSSIRPLLSSSRRTVISCSTVTSEPELSPFPRESTSIMTNRLAKAKSPYLLQHANNPVDWYEWGTEAFDKAKKENKPIFLSVGYSACHWCHVLAHESFEDELTAKLMNEHYVNVKVDREERPDVDRLYMTFLQATSGGGGWPMSVWLTPDLHPFFAGTYFPRGQFRQVLVKLSEIWKDDPERCTAMGKQVIEAIRAASETTSEASQSQQQEKLAKDASIAVYERLARTYDPKCGGFGGAPKFPSPSQTMHFLARFAALNGDTEQERKALDMAVSTLVGINKGGIKDIVGDGFSRYSVDEHWHIPHFEKMLYDQGQLLSSALELANLLPKGSASLEDLQAMAHSILTYVSRDLRAPEGAFYSAEDADSLPGNDSTVKKEGAFYVWTASALDQVLGSDADIFKYHFGVKPGGNCDPRHDIQGELSGQNVLYTAHTIDETASRYSRTSEETTAHLEWCIAKLKAHRDANRPRPHLDDKILCAWNGLMISGLSKASETLDESIHSGQVTRADALRLAEDAAGFIEKNMYDTKTGVLRRSWREGPGPIGQADDYAFLIQGLLDLYEASGNEKYAGWAIRLQDKQDELFYDEVDGGYFASAPDEHILVRMKDAQDGAEPSAVSVTLSNLYRLAHTASDGHTSYEAKAESILRSNAPLLTQAPHALATMVSSALCATTPGYRQYIVTGPGTAPETLAFLAKIRSKFIPNRVLLYVDPQNLPRELAKANETLKTLVKETEKKRELKPNVRLCENFACSVPVYNVESLKV